MTTIPDHPIDKAARALQRLTWRGPLPAWEDTPAHIQDALRNDASAILDAVADDLRAEAWAEGALTAWSVSTTEVNGQRYHWRRSGEPRNPYRQEQNNE